MTRMLGFDIIYGIWKCLVYVWCHIQFFVIAEILPSLAPIMFPPPVRILRSHHFPYVTQFSIQDLGYNVQVVPGLFKALQSKLCLLAQIPSPLLSHPKESAAITIKKCRTTTKNGVAASACSSRARMEVGRTCSHIGNPALVRTIFLDQYHQKVRNCKDTVRRWVSH